VLGVASEKSIPVGDLCQVLAPKMQATFEAL